MSQQDYPCWLLLCLGEVSFKMDSRGISNDLGINDDFRYMSIVAKICQKLFKNLSEVSQKLVN
ncbi:hypothetical protein MiTa_02327 [Microcystis aeruginosa NIES-4264]|nr:hypothetical protein MiTa_02327 [Microcystis aeruginosa NIES-4264]